MIDSIKIFGDKLYIDLDPVAVILPGQYGLAQDMMDTANEAMDFYEDREDTLEAQYRTGKDDGREARDKEIRDKLDNLWAGGHLDDDYYKFMYHQLLDDTPELAKIKKTKKHKKD